MNFYDLLAIIVVSLGLSHLAVSIMIHRQNMAKIKAGAWKLDGNKIAASAKKHLPIRDGHYVIPEEWKAR